MCFSGPKPPAAAPAPVAEGADALKLGDAADNSAGMARLMLRLGNSATGQIAPSASGAPPATAALASSV